MTPDWRAHTQATDDGHLLWTAHHSNDTPTIYLNYKKISVPGHVYTVTRGRPPVGHVTTSCRVRDCVQPDHLQDADDRHERWLAAAREQGLPTTEGYCAKGHAWAESIHFDYCPRRRCSHCRQGLPPVVRETAVELALAGVPDDLARTDALEVARRAICVRGLTHEQTAALVGKSPRTVTRWAVRHQWRKPVTY